MIYTMGSALNRALEDHSEVAILVDGIWLTGRVAMYDGVGVVLDNHDEHSIVRVDNIAAVRILSQLPWHPASGEPMPMPSPRASNDA
jgi:sRNA-binding regulator protein Hfq